VTIWAERGRHRVAVFSAKNYCARNKSAVTRVNTYHNLAVVREVKHGLIGVGKFCAGFYVYFHVILLDMYDMYLNYFWVLANSYLEVVCLVCGG
jgi:hypothetical protein